jgi:hypothetical protein
LFNIKTGGESKMKKIVLFSIIALIGLTASAADQTKEQFIAASKARAEKAGKEFNAAATEKQFAAKDTNKDGKLSAEELAAKPAARPAAKPAAKPAAAE